MKTLTFSQKSFQLNLFTELVAIFRKPLMNLKIVSKAPCDSENYSKSRRQHVDCNVKCNLEKNRPMREKKIRNRNYDAAFGTIFEIVNIVRQTEKKLNLIFSLKQAEKTVSTTYTC
jgi:hypothetical protein